MAFSEICRKLSILACRVSNFEGQMGLCPNRHGNRLQWSNDKSLMIRLRG